MVQPTPPFPAFWWNPNDVAPPIVWRDDHGLPYTSIMIDRRKRRLARQKVATRRATR